MTIPKLGDLLIFPDKSLAYVHYALSKKEKNINYIHIKCKLAPDTDYLKKSWLRFYMPVCNMESDFYNGFSAEHDNFVINKFGNKLLISATHRKWNECCRLSGWEVIQAKAIHQKVRPS